MSQIDLVSLKSKPRIGVTRTRPKEQNQARPATPLWVTWQPRGDDDSRPWILGGSEPLSPDTRYSSGGVIELTDVPSMVMDYDNIGAVLDFIAPEYSRGDNHGACLYLPGHADVWLGQGTTVWKLPDGRCYIQHRSSSLIMFAWPPIEVKP